MKAFVIKNKDGKYLEISVDYEGFDRLTFFEDIVDATIFETKEYPEYKVFGTGLKDYKIVPITICEGDLEEKYRVLEGVIHFAMDYACRDKKLYKRIQDFNINTNRHNGDNNVYLEDAVCFLTKLSKDARDDAKKWGEFFEKAYQEQKAKEENDV